MTDECKICIVLGTRAQLIKTAPVMRELQSRGIPYYFLYTAQHRHTYPALLAEFGLKHPDRTLFEWDDEASTAWRFLYWFVRAFGLLIRAGNLLPFRQVIVMVHGDTMSTLWGALLAKLSGNRLFHLESGLRSFNFLNPLPEELVRVIVMRLADIYACQSEVALQNVAHLSGEKLLMGQNTVVDSMRYIMETKVDTLSHNKDFVIVTIHRAENVYNIERLSLIIETLERVSQKYRVIFPLHPLTRSRLIETKLMDRLETNPHIELRDRLPYGEFIPYLARARFIMTDSGSLQEEVQCLGTPMLVFRSATERQEGLGANIILSNYDVALIDRFIAEPEIYRHPKQMPHITPSQIVVDWLENHLS